MKENFLPKHSLVKEPHPEDWVFCFERQELFLLEENKIPHFGECARFLNQEAYYCFGELNNRQCLLIDDYENLKKHPEFTSYPIRELLPHLEKLLISGLLKASHLAYWRRTHRFCGNCGSPLIDMVDELARFCEKCSHIAYPRISPCIIVLISRGEEILLARSAHFPQGVYSTLAGFLDPGESAEEGVKREIYEEVGLKVNNIQYHTSQAWPFPDSLMLGFTADYEAGEIQIDPKEIEDAQWFNPKNLPKVPPTFSIARALIDSHLKKIGII